MTIQARLVYKYQVALTNGRHNWLSDEPISDNGTDIAPNPYDLLLSSLAACKAMTVKMYSERKGWPLTGFEITVSHSKIKAENCTECQSTTGFVDIFDCQIQLHGDDLTEEQRERIIEIADRCPVHRTLMSENVIRTAQLKN